MRDASWSENGSAVVFLLVILVLVIVGLIGISIISSKKNQQQFAGAPAGSTNGNLQLNAFQIANKPYGILEVAINYNSANSPVLSITNVKNILGFSPRLPATVTPYTLKLVDGSGKQLYAMPLSVPNNFPDDSTLWNPSHQGTAIVLPQVSFTEVVPAISSTAAVEILNNQNQIISQKKIESGFGTGAGLSYSTATAPASTVYNFTLISDDYTQAQLSQFHTDATNFKNYLLSVVPFSSHTSQVQFHTIDNTTDLSCAPPANAPANSATIVCDTSKVLAQVDAAKVPYDIIIVVINASQQEGAWDIGTPYSFVSNGGANANQVFQHEVGHDFGGLHDEYSIDETGNITNNVDKNCLAGSPPAAAWQGIVNTSDYNQNCTYTNWYRSSSESIMSTTSVNYYNAISQQIIKERFGDLSGASPSASDNPEPAPTSSNSAQAASGTPYGYNSSCDFAPKEPIPTGIPVASGVIGVTGSALPDYFSDPNNHTYSLTATLSACPAGYNVRIEDYPVDPSYLNQGSVSCDGQTWWQSYDPSGVNANLLPPPAIYGCVQN